MKRVHKYPLPFPLTDSFSLQLPSDYQIVHVGLDPAGDAVFWAIVDPSKLALTVHFRLFGTGNMLPEFLGPHVGSFVQGAFVGHLFRA